jgi:hypothetical protein
MVNDDDIYQENKDVYVLIIDKDFGFLYNHNIYDL